ncbi:MAG TPA: Minf_1886 family protein [Chthoniobacter sp.]
MTAIIGGEMSKMNLCQECFESEHPDAASQAESQLAAQLEAGCRYCGRQCRATLCRRCAVEYQRIMKLKGFFTLDREVTEESMAKRLRIVQEVEAHMRKWVSEREPDELQPSTGSFPPDATFERFARADSRFKMEAYRFVAQVVRKAFAEHSYQHISGREVALAFRTQALEEFGKDALDTLIDWGIYTTFDIGTIVFQMVASGLLGARAEDKPEDFQAIYDFATAFPRQ